MPNLLRRVLRSGAALCCGAALGYFVLDLPIIPAATQSVVEWFVPLVKDIDAWLYSRNLQYLLIAALVFIATVPNVVLLSLISALAMKWLRQPRLVFYASLIWPAIHYLLDMERILRIMAGAKRLGQDLDLNLLLLAENIPTKACGMLLVYSLYSGFTFIFYRQLSRIRHNPPLNTDAPTSGAPVS